MIISLILLIALAQLLFAVLAIPERLSSDDRKELLSMFYLVIGAGACSYLLISNIANEQKTIYVNTEWEQCENQGGKINVRWSEAIKKIQKYFVTLVNDLEEVKTV